MIRVASVAPAIPAASVLAMALTGCGVFDAVPSSTPDELLPRQDAFLPPDAVVATPWLRMGNMPEGFEPAGHASPEDLADAFVAAIVATYGDAADPELGLDVIDQTADGSVLIVSETAVGDDSVAGSQHAVVVASGSDGWHVEQLWTRALCRRGITDDLCV